MNLHKLAADLHDTQQVLQKAIVSGTGSMKQVEGINHVFSCSSQACIVDYGSTDHICI
jgi:hypothetical protein